MIKNLALKGGGVKGVAYVGAIKELDKAGVFDTIERVAGTSAGALMACMISLGYSVPQIEELMVSMDFGKFKGGWNPLRIYTRFGLYSGQYILDLVGGYLKNSPKNLTEDATFKDMHEAGCRDLYVFACNTGMHSVHEFSADKTPDVKVKEAIRASMSIPFFFKGWKFTHPGAREHVFIDGGVVYNYPLSFFDDARFTDDDVNKESLGLYLYSTQTPRDIYCRWGRPLFFSHHLFESILDAQDYIVLADREQTSRSILIDDLGFSATDFGISADKKNALMVAGSSSAQAYITKHRLVTTLQDAGVLN
jgi:NTE family protein